MLGTQRILAYKFQGKRYDAGDKLGFLQATVSLPLKMRNWDPRFAPI